MQDEYRQILPTEVTTMTVLKHMIKYQIYHSRAVYFITYVDSNNTKT